MGLYELIKQEYTKKGKPLKIVVDWDECLCPTKPYIIYLEQKIKTSFETFFKNFWESAQVDAMSISGNSIIVADERYQGSKEEADAINEFERKRRESRKNPEEHIFNPIEDFYNKSPFLSIAEELLKALKEGLVTKLIIITSYRKGTANDEGGWRFIKNKSAEKVVDEKTRKFNTTWKKFPQAELCLTGVIRDKEGKFRPYRWEELRDKYPDFDIFIDDNPNIMKECLKNLQNQKEKCFVLPNYLSCRKVTGDNIYHVKITISNLKDSDFIYVYNLPKENPTPEQKTNESINEQPSQENNKIYWIIGSLVFASLVGLIIWFVFKKKNK